MSKFLETVEAKIVYNMKVLKLISKLQHANEDVEKMILGNKCDMDDKRTVSKDRGEAVSEQILIYSCTINLDLK